MADLSSFLDDSDDCDSDDDDMQQQHATSPDTDNEQDGDDNDIEMEANKPISMLIDSSSNKTIRAEDLFAFQAQKDKEQNKTLPSATIDHQTSLNFDLGHVCCYDPVSINIDELFKHKKDCKPRESKKMPTDYTKLDQAAYDIRKLKEKYLYDMTRQNVQAMVNKLYSLQPMKSGPNDDPGLVVKLPAPRLKLPRAKPIPETKPMTRWEKFALRRGIRTSKKTKDLLQWDESTKSWKKKYGYNKANDPMDAPILFEHKDNDFDTVSPWNKMKKEKKKRIAINKENQMRNLKEAFGDRIGGTLDLQSAMDYNKNKNKRKIGNRALRQNEKVKKQKFGHLNVALSVAQHSTASMGKFDQLNRNESKPELKKNRKKSVGYMQTNENTKVHQYKFGKDSFDNKERSKQKEILFNIFGKEQSDAFNKEKAVGHAQYQIEKKRARSKVNRSRKKK